MESPQKEKGLIIALLEGASDTDAGVRKAISHSLIKLGCQHACLVLTSIRGFLDNTQTTPKAHIQSILYNTAEGIVKERGEHINDKDLVQKWVKASEQLLIQSSIAHDLQQAASNFLVSLACSKTHSTHVLTSLIKILEADDVPPQTVIETLASVATSNSRGSSYYFSIIMASLLPYLAHVKHDNLRSAIASMLAKFSEAVVDAVANKGLDDTLSLEGHHDHCSSIYDVLVHHWLKTSNVLVKNEVILCLGHMSYLLPKEKLEIYATGVVSSIIGHYKRNPCPFTITYSLALLCDAIIQAGIENCIRVHIDSTLNTLFSQVCVAPNFSEPHTVKNHCEVLRCFDILSKSFPDLVINLLVQRLENASYVQRVGSLQVLKHLINSHSVQTDHVSKVVSVLGLSLSDPNSKVVRNVAQVIVALCHNGHLDRTSGTPFISYLVQHAAGGSLDSRRRNSLNEVGEEFVGDVCCRALNLLATSVSPAVPLLWPCLIQYTTNLEYQKSFPTIFSCLAALLQDPQTTHLDSTTPTFAQSGHTSAPFVLSHLLVMCCMPKDASLGLPILATLQGLAHHIAPNLSPVWEDHLPQLRETYAALVVSTPDPSSVQMWQDSLRDFFGCSIEAIGSDAFTSSLVSAQMEQLEIWEKNPIYRCFLMSAVGVTLKHCTNGPLIDSTLDALYNRINHKSFSEQESFSLAVGTCSVTHMSIVLSHIESWLKNTDTMKRSTLSLFHLLKSQDMRAEDASWARSSLVLCLGHIASLASPELVGSYVDGPIMLHLLNIINSNKSDLVNDVTLQTLSKIAKALLCLPSFRLRQRPLFLTHVVSTIKQENLSLNSLAGALQVLRDMAALEPELNVEERTIVLQASLSSTLQTLQKAVTLDSYTERCYSQLNVLIRTLIQHDTCPATLDDVTTLLHAWTLSPYEVVRVKALDLLYSSFCTFLQHLVLTHSGPTTFNQTCQLLAMLTPRCADPCKEIRSQAVSCLIMVLKILNRYKGHGPDYVDDDLSSLKAVDEGSKESEGMDTSDVLILIAKVLCNKLSFVQLRLYISLVVIGLQDLQAQSSSGVAQILSTIFTYRGHQFHQHIKEILDLIYRRLEKVYDPETRRYSIEALCNLAKHNIVTVVDSIMTYPVPYEKSICETLQRIGCETELCGASLTHFTHILERTQLFTEHETASQEDVKIASLPTLTAICSMKELLTKLSSRYTFKDTSMQSPSIVSEQLLDTTGSQQIVALVIKEFELDTLQRFEPESESDGFQRLELELEIFQTNFTTLNYNICLSSTTVIVSERLPSLVALLLLSYGSYIGTMAPLHQSSSDISKNSFIPNRNATGLTPSKCALECLQALVSISGCSQLEDALSSELLNPNVDSVEEFLQSISTIVILFVQEAPIHISSLVAYLDTHHNHEIQRMTVTAVFGELVAAKCCGDFELLEIITSGLLSRLNDKSSQVRRLAVKGLANFAHLQKDQMSDKMSEVVSALVGATDLREGSEAVTESQVALEAMRGLASLLPHLSSSLIVQHTPTLLIRIRLFVEKSNGEVREASMGVLRGLSVSVGDSEDFKEHIPLHLLTALVHLEDPHPSMVVMCKSALQSLGPHLGSKDIQKLFEEQLVPSGTLNYQDFVANISQKLVSDMDDQIGLFLQVSSSYFRHSEPTIRRASILLAGHLINYSSEQAVIGSLQRIYHGLTFLLRDADHSVRTAAAFVVPLLAKHEKVL